MHGLLQRGSLGGREEWLPPAGQDARGCRPSTASSRSLGALAALAVLAALISFVAQGLRKPEFVLPSAESTVVLIRSTLLSLNDAPTNCLRPLIGGRRAVHNLP